MSCSIAFVLVVPAVVVVVLPEVLVQVTWYVVVVDGDTGALPDVAPPVEKSELVQEVAF